ncbi:MAG TPA: penicillin-binding transpeptidase domain-containing protein [Solirubrobacteraceae bacterium]|nr:penicillin-binding transpeptidase domain-containing protein [Solirubrobacteraceae bacterium]
MNASIARLFGLVLVLFALLVGFTSRWTVFEAEALRDNSNNRRELLAEQLIKRGLIRADDGRVLARSPAEPQKRFGRRYPTGPLFAQAVGCTSLDRGRAGLEDFYNDALTGRATNAIDAVTRLFGPAKVGDDLRTTLSEKAQKVATDALASREQKGAVVALELKTGAVKVLAAKPSFDPNGADCGANLNLATQGLFPPGSTMKAVTASAAIDSGKYQPDSRVSGRNGKEISGAPLNNFGDEDFGDIDLTFALTNSVNTVWAEVAEKLGKRTMAEYMEKFGFYADPPMDYPDNQMVASGVNKGRKRLVKPTSDQVDIGRVAIGQGDLEVTPLQMATVAQTIGNGGVRMEPRLVAKVVDQDGRTVDEPLPQEAERVMSEDSAQKVGDMMRNVVKEGTGTAAALEGVDVAGKTGTAEVNLQGLNDPWFIGFTDRFAVAVVFERVQGGTGGTISAPVAKAVLESLGE